jgi:hypothetical protein
MLHPDRFTPGKETRYRRLGGTYSRSELMRTISRSPELDPRIVQPIASRYTDWGIFKTVTWHKLFVTCMAVIRAGLRYTHARTHTRAHTHKEKHVILITFPLQQWFHERACMLLYAYIACLVNSLTYSMEQSPSWEAKTFWATQEIPRILWKPEGS